ncbi:DUF4255 domain-containing protein [Aequorivita lipolytica]|uniref:DUF4255 domain-containing protein n=1 Tax=Aequorivita lipolytica TaxID=153267 RepID=A0A5C6YQK0_9FLAO|nr:DUF4255 domain-containing protein [Aequorivita lipolytica]TXD69637.1 DUF4255 domain-containing protein [Aequorivita lipolytica]SRX51127.1 hypothetical protein AEQU2_01607 [Aequorivita lipolytica]
MIYETLEIVKDQVSKYLEQKTTEANLVVLENVSKHDDPELNTMNDKIVLSLLNIEEEVALKNNPNVKFKNGETIYKNAPINLNVFALFSANRSTYTRSLTAISLIIEFFQSKKIFTQVNTPLNPAIPALENIKEFRFIAELYTPTFEQLNYIWGTMGGKALPSVLYKISVVKIDSNAILEKGKPIIEISGILNNNT